MTNSLRIKYRPEVCSDPHCGQTLTYLLALDRGTTDILKAFSVAVWCKGINQIHPRKEMEIAGRGISYEESVREGHLRSNQVGNLSRAHRHGLIAKVKGLPGTWLLTRKGAAYLRGESVPKYAVISKVTGHQIGYWNEESARVMIGDFTPEHEYWELPAIFQESKKVEQVPLFATL